MTPDEIKRQKAQQEAQRQQNAADARSSSPGAWTAPTKPAQDPRQAELRRRQDAARQRLIAEKNDANYKRTRDTWMDAWIKATPEYKKNIDSGISDPYYGLRSRAAAAFDSKVAENQGKHSMDWASKPQTAWPNITSVAQPGATTRTTPSVGGRGGGLSYGGGRSGASSITLTPPAAAPSATTAVSAPSKPVVISAEVARIKRIQNLNGVPETGVWDDATDKKYKEVKGMQEMLNRKRGLNLATDGIFGTLTRTAVMGDEIKDKQATAITPVSEVSPITFLPQEEIRRPYQATDNFSKREMDINARQEARHQRQVTRFANKPSTGSMEGDNIRDYRYATRLQNQASRQDARQENRIARHNAQTAPVGPAAQEEPIIPAARRGGILYFS